jgi:hypothetical protein
MKFYTAPAPRRPSSRHTRFERWHLVMRQWQLDDYQAMLRAVGLRHARRVAARKAAEQFAARPSIIQRRTPKPRRPSSETRVLEAARMFTTTPWRTGQ